MTGSRAVRLWRGALLACSVILYALALSNQAYEVTSPPAFSFHVLLRKAYSIGAFAVFGFLVMRSRLPGLARPQPVAVGVGLYSAAIEVGQYLTGVREGLASNAFDVLCGIVGGALGAVIARFI